MGPAPLNLNQVSCGGLRAVTGGLSIANPIGHRVHAVEMVYIPQGAFYVGAGPDKRLQPWLIEANPFTDGVDPDQDTTTPSA